jgi:glycosyltransferase involved in cell wall biosynthesis
MAGAVGEAKSSPTVAVIIPCRNEAASLPYVFSRMPLGIDEVLLVDGGSTDDSILIARNLYPAVRIVHQTRTGKGNALVCGLSASTSDIVVTVDADGSADPTEIPRFVQALLDGADFAKGSRCLPGGGSDDLTHLRSVGNRALTATVNVLFKRDFSDLCYGFNAFWRAIIPLLALPDPELDTKAPGTGMLPGDGFEIETLLTLRALSAGLRIVEVPSFEAHRLHGVSNLSSMRDGRRVLSTILAERRRSQSTETAPVSPSPAGAAQLPAPRRPDHEHLDPDAAVV